MTASPGNMETYPEITPDVLVRLKRTELEILLAVDKTCRSIGVDYFLDSGTLLGAARHKGFIPWDDDIDIGMMRPDYERFLAEGQGALGSDFFIQTPTSDKESPFPFAKVRKTGTQMLERATKGRSMNHGIWVDVFPFDQIDAGKFNLKRLHIAKRCYYRLYFFLLSDENSVPRHTFKGVVKRVVAPPLKRLVPMSYFYRKLNGLASKAPVRKVGVYTCLLYPISFPKLTYRDIFPLSSLEFEGHSFPVMQNWDKYLVQMYGNWEDLPPEEDRRTHGGTEIRF